MRKSLPRSPGPFFPKRSLGQNFLVDPRVRQKIIEACGLMKDDVVLEIGPGKGALTAQIAGRAGRVFAVEKDDYLAARLQEQFGATGVSVIHDDILRFPWENLPARMKLVGNLPYNISTPILEKIFQHRERFETVFITVQLEYALRLSAAPGTRDYGSLSCFAQYYADIRKLFKIKNTAFRPVPKVDSCFVRLDMLTRPRVAVGDESLLFKVIRLGFEQRRKMISNSLASAVGARGAGDFWAAAGVDPKLRAEDLSLEDYARLTNALTSRGG